MVLDERASTRIMLLAWGDGVLGVGGEGQGGGSAVTQQKVPGCLLVPPGDGLASLT